MEGVVGSGVQEVPVRGGGGGVGNRVDVNVEANLL